MSSSFIDHRHKRLMMVVPSCPSFKANRFTNKNIRAYWWRSLFVGEGRDEASSERCPFPLSVSQTNHISPITFVFKFKFSLRFILSFRVNFEFDFSLRSSFSLVVEFNLIDLVLEIDLHRVVDWLHHLFHHWYLQSPSNEPDPPDVVSDIIFFVDLLLIWVSSSLMFFSHMELGFWVSNIHFTSSILFIFTKIYLCLWDHGQFLGFIIYWASNILVFMVSDAKTITCER